MEDTASAWERHRGSGIAAQVSPPAMLPSPVLALLHDLVAARSPSREEGPSADVLEGWLVPACARVGGDFVRADRNIEIGRAHV